MPAASQACDGRGAVHSIAGMSWPPFDTVGSSDGMFHGSPGDDEDGAVDRYEVEGQLRHDLLKVSKSRRPVCHIH